MQFLVTQTKMSYIYCSVCN